VVEIVHAAPGASLAAKTRIVAPKAAVTQHHFNADPDEAAPGENLGNVGDKFIMTYDNKTLLEGIVTGGATGQELHRSPKVRVSMCVLRLIYRCMTLADDPFYCVFCS
jgi:hypothetical protein